MAGAGQDDRPEPVVDGRVVAELRERYLLVDGPVQQHGGHPGRAGLAQQGQRVDLGQPLVEHCFAAEELEGGAVAEVVAPGGGEVGDRCEGEHARRQGARVPARAGGQQSAGGTPQGQVATGAVARQDVGPSLRQGVHDPGDVVEGLGIAARAAGAAEPGKQDVEALLGEVGREGGEVHPVVAPVAAVQEDDHRRVGIVGRPGVVGLVGVVPVAAVHRRQHRLQAQDPLLLLGREGGDDPRRHRAPPTVRGRPGGPRASPARPGLRSPRCPASSPWRGAPPGRARTASG